MRVVNHVNMCCVLWDWWVTQKQWRPGCHAVDKHRPKDLGGCWRSVTCNVRPAQAVACHSAMRTTAEGCLYSASQLDTATVGWQRV
jgi:hypothetical protein